MRFLRENVFYVSLIAGVLVCIVALVVMGTGPRGDVGDEIDKRKDTDGSLDRVRTAPNEDGLKRRREWVRRIQSKAREIQKRSSEWNRRNCEVLTLTLPSGERRKAFPATEELRDESLTVPGEFTRTYGAIHEGWVRSLRPATPARQERIDSRAKVIEEQLKATRQPVEGAALATGVEVGLAEQAKREAEARVLLEQARSGWMYVGDVADPNGLGMTFPDPKARAAFDELWRGQVELWIKRDLFTAVAQTNKSVVRKKGEAAGTDPNKIDESQMSVLTAPIKHLASIRIDPFYCTRQGQEGRGSSGSRVTYATGAAEPDQVATLTQRTSCREYDVVQYDVTVVMPVRYLPVLVDNLIAQNYHTILKVDAREVVRFGERAGSSGTVYYYYGPEPVVKVTIYGEVLFLTDWSRELMPREVLRKLQARDAAALRPEDRRRAASSL